MLGLSAWLVQAANAMLDSSICLVKELPGSSRPSILQVLVHKQQHGLLVDPSLPRVPGHPGEPTTAPCLMSLTGPKMAVRGAAKDSGTEVSCLSLPLALPVPLMAHSIPLQINFFIFIRIIQILVSKLRAHQMRYTDYKFRWVLDMADPVFPWCTHTCVHPVTPVPQAGQVHTDADPTAGHPRGGLRLHHRRARPGHTALHQALLRPLPELFPGEPSPHRTSPP